MTRAGSCSLILATIVGLIANALYTGFVVDLVADVRADGRRDMSAGQLHLRRPRTRSAD